MDFFFRENKQIKTVKEMKSYIDYIQKKGFCATKNSITRNEGKGATDMNYMEAKWVFLHHLEHNSQSNIAPAP